MKRFKVKLQAKGVCVFTPLHLDVIWKNFLSEFYVANLN